MWLEWLEKEKLGLPQTVVWQQMKSTPKVVPGAAPAMAQAGVGGYIYIYVRHIYIYVYTCTYIYKYNSERERETEREREADCIMVLKPLHDFLVCDKFYSLPTQSASLLGEYM